MRSICEAQITFFEKARKTAKNEENLLRPFVMEALRRSGLRTARYRLRSISPAPSLLLSPQSLPTLRGPLIRFLGTSTPTQTGPRFLGDPFALRRYQNWTGDVFDARKPVFCCTEWIVFPSRPDCRGLRRHTNHSKSNQPNVHEINIFQIRHFRDKIQSFDFYSYVC